MFQDEAGFGRINKPKYCWCERGIRPSVPCHHIREYYYAFGAVEPLTGNHFFLILPKCNTACMNVFLRELSNTYPNDIILLCCAAFIGTIKHGISVSESFIGHIAFSRLTTCSGLKLPAHLSFLNRSIPRFNGESTGNVSTT